ncbi:thiosulfate oxidation carrier protein SoxY [Sinorhizobium alkalisoli]|uniref:thiosulfate oxidation carrier protein SoxY n=1 Tax=Sinorhizobium alkalisoli TaxID=1752398 RepID=UPI00124C89D9|nr:thiosulfate oxidation carrier protein SoxY [Sinorhizobium alkalisoli]QFI68591.1 Sulfur oxidation protein SoxY [Sinorhizobium alkalisoli]
MSLTRRRVLTGVIGTFACVLAPGLKRTRAADEAESFIEEWTGRKATPSDRVHLAMPAEFSTGYTVPVGISVESPMTDNDHVKSVRVFAPKNPLVEVVQFHFAPGRSLPRVSTRIRLAAPQHIVALAEMSDGSLLMAKTWVAVATNGCE